MTVHSIDAIQQTTAAVAPEQVKIPQFFNKGIKALCWIHRIWRGARTARAARDLPTFASYLGGAVLNLTYGDKRGVRIAAQAVMIALRVVECVENFALMQIHYKALTDELTGRAILPHKPSWKHCGPAIIFTPAAYQAIKDVFELKMYRLKRVIFLTCMVVYHIFDISMCVYDASQGLSLDNEFVNENINEIFINTYDLWNKLTNDLPFLAQKLNENSMVIDALIQNISRSPVKTHHLLKVCTAVAAVRETVHNAAHAVKDKCVEGGEAIVEGARKAVSAMRDKDYVDPNIRYIDDGVISPPVWPEQNKTPCEYFSS